MAADLLRLEGVVAGHGDATVLHGVDLALPEGRSLALLGRNGAGKTTLIETLMGHTRVTAGAIRWRGEDIVRWPAHRRARAGLGWVPQAREVFPSLTVEENLTVAARPGPWDARRVCAAFPQLRERRRHFGNQLSGGEQQMLAIGRALVTQPRLLLLDEPMEGLAPTLVASLADTIRRLCDQEGLASIVVEQHPDLALAMTHEVLVLERGKVVHSGPSAALAADAELRDRLLGIGIGIG